VVTTESPDSDLGRVHSALAAVPGVLTVSMVVAYRDRAEEPV
jgi:nitrate reductase NapAB chaperone NapD